MPSSQPKMIAAKTPRVIRKFDPAWRLKQVAASYAPGATVAAVARRADIRPNLLSYWRKRYGAKFRGRGTATKFVPVRTTPPSAPTAPAPTGSWIEIDLASGLLRLRGAISAAQLREVLAAVR